VRAFAEQPHVHLAQHGAEAVGVFLQRFVAVGPAHTQLVAAARGQGGGPAEHAIGMQQRQCPGACAAHHHHGHRAGEETAHVHGLVGPQVRPQHGTGVAVAAQAQGVDLVRVRHLVSLQAQVLGVMPQTSRAYSAIVRSEEKKPMPATFAMAFLAQAARSR